MVPLGWRLTEDLRFAREQDAVTLTFSESTDQILHTPTKEENLKLLEYEEARKEFWNCIAMTIFGLGVPLYNAFREWLPIMRAEKRKEQAAVAAQAE